MNDYEYAVITTKYLSPTQEVGSRIKARMRHRTATVNYDHSLGPDEAHRAAAKKLVEKFNSVQTDYHASEPVKSAFSPDTGFHFIIRLSAIS